MRLLITRPEPDAAHFAEALRARGHEALIAPLLTVQFYDTPILLDGIDAILVTSANGVRALARLAARRDVKLLAVGSHSRAVAAAEGFTDCASADGDGAALLAAIPSFLPAGSKLLHAMGANGAALALPGYDIRRTVVYGIAAADHMPPAAAEALRAGALNGAVFFSPDSAKAFRRCAEEDGLSRYCAGLAAYCISAAAAKSLASLAFAQICIAKAPNGAEILDMLPKMQA
jgi:uroporphyrinogen-III synthase